MMVGTMFKKGVIFLLVICGATQKIVGGQQTVAVTVRLATKGDIAACVQLATDVYRNVYKPLESVSDQARREEEITALSEPSDLFSLYTSQLLVAETTDKKVIGCVMVAPFNLPDVSQFMRNALPINFDLLAQRFHGAAAYIFRLYVDEKYRGNGIGKKLLKGTVFFGPFEKIYLDTIVLNTNAINFYKHLGFVREYETMSPNNNQVVVLSIDTNQL